MRSPSQFAADNKVNVAIDAASGENHSFPATASVPGPMIYQRCPEYMDSLRNFEYATVFILISALTMPHQSGIKALVITNPLHLRH